MTENILFAAVILDLLTSIGFSLSWNWPEVAAFAVTAMVEVDEEGREESQRK